MSFKRNTAQDEYSEGPELTKKLNAIGIRLGGALAKNPNIEDTLIAAAHEGVAGDFRVLGLLTDWFSVHFERVNVDRLVRALSSEKEPRVKAYFSAIGNLLEKDTRYKRLRKIYRGDVLTLALGPEGMFLLKRNGADERFVGSKLLVAKGELRSRLDDIMSPQELSKIHFGYYYRVLVGPSYRADMIAAFKTNSKLTASQLAKQTYGSFATAWRVMKDLKILD